MPPVPEPSSQPALTPQFCFNTTALRDFLRLSRASVDDSISAHLNALLQPSRSNPFLPSMTATRSISSTADRSRQNVPREACSQFKQHVLYPSWERRDRVLTFCHKVSRREEEASDSTGPKVLHNPWGVVQTPDERTDPYSARDYSYTRAPREEVLEDIVRTEMGVEQVVKSRTWGVLRDRCIGGAETSVDGWQHEYHDWCDRSEPRG